MALFRVMCSVVLVSCVVLCVYVLGVMMSVILFAQVSCLCWLIHICVHIYTICLSVTTVYVCVSWGCHGLCFMLCCVLSLCVCAALCWCVDFVLCVCLFVSYLCDVVFVDVLCVCVRKVCRVN